jgi:hypothetical protein
MLYHYLHGQFITICTAKTAHVLRAYFMTASNSHACLRVQYTLCRVLLCQTYVSEAWVFFTFGQPYTLSSDSWCTQVESELRDFVLGGVALEGPQKDRFNKIQQELAQLSTKFSNNVLDATKAFKKLVTSKEEVGRVTLPTCDRV